jgi:hypothetical protein
MMGGKTAELYHHGLLFLFLLRCLVLRSLPPLLALLLQGQINVVLLHTRIVLVALFTGKPVNVRRFRG